MIDEPPPADLLSLVSIAGAAIDARVLAGMNAAGFDTVRVTHGYLIQRLLLGPQLISAMAADLGVSQQADVQNGQGHDPARIGRSTHR